MMSSTLGAPLGGTTRGGHQVFDPWRVSLITPPNFGGGGGSCFPSIVVVALAEPGTPVVFCWAFVPAVASRNNRKTAASRTNRWTRRCSLNLISSPYAVAP